MVHHSHLLHLLHNPHLLAARPKDRASKKHRNAAAAPAPVSKDVPQRGPPIPNVIAGGNEPHLTQASQESVIYADRRHAKSTQVFGGGVTNAGSPP